MLTFKYTPFNTLVSKVCVQVHLCVSGVGGGGRSCVRDPVFYESKYHFFDLQRLESLVSG